MVPRNAKVCGPVFAVVTDVTDSFWNTNRDRDTIGVTPLIFNPT